MLKQDIRDLMPAFDPRSVPFPKTIKLSIIPYRSSEKRTVYRLDGYYDDLPVGLTKHRQQYRMVGKNLFKVVSVKERKPKDAIPAVERAALIDKLGRHGVTFGEILPRSLTKIELVKATPQERLDYEDKVFLLKSHCHDMMVARAQRKYERKLAVLAAALKDLNAADLEVVKPPVPTQA